MTIKSSWIYRSYKKGDEIEILNLFEKVFGKKMVLDFWKWRFVENPFGRGMINLLFDNNLLIGHYAVIPMGVQVKNNLIQAVFAMTTMTHPDYQRQGIFSYLAGETYREAAKRGFKFVYGFPNKNAHYGLVKKLDWKDLGRITFFYKELRKDLLTSISQNGNVYEIKNFDNTVDLLWNKIKKNYCVIVPRTKDFLNWRFIKNPDTNYKIYSIKDKEKMLGYVVLKLYKRENEEIGHIVDILGGNDSIIEKLLQVSYNYFFGNNIKKILCWIQDSYSPSALMKKEGFIRKDFDAETYFGVKILSEKDNSLKEVECFNNWYLTMGDSDVF
jgi:predicted acetyltransferase